MGVEEVNTTSTEFTEETKEDRDVQRSFIDEVLPKNDPTRIRAEKTATPMSMESLLLKGYIEQTFEITPSLKVTMRSLSAGLVEYIGVKLSEKYEDAWNAVFQEAARMYYLAASLQKIGDVSLGKDLQSLEGDELDEEFFKRLKHIKSLSSNLVYLLYNHYLLFNERVDNFIKGGSETLGNS